jgi:hypothetical protein
MPRVVMDNLNQIIRKETVGNAAMSTLLNMVV